MFWYRVIFLFLCGYGVLGMASTLQAFERFGLVSTNELVQLLEKRSRGEVQFILVNTLDEIIYRDQAIPGSINVPWSQVDTRYPELGSDKEQSIITYCVGYR